MLAGQPDAIVKVTPQKGRYEATDDTALREEVEAVRARPGYDALTAVQQGRIFVLASEIHGGPRAPIGAAYEARWIHPGLCADIDPVAWNREYLEKFQRVPVRGSYAWPAPDGEEQR